jgi:hypothetical protein
VAHRRRRSERTANTPAIASLPEPAHGPATWREHRAVAGSVVVGPAFVARMGRADFLCRLIYRQKLSLHGIILSLAHCLSGYVLASSCRRAHVSMTVSKDGAVRDVIPASAMRA